MMSGFVQTSFYQADHRRKVVRFRRLSSVTRRGVFCGAAEVLERSGQVDKMIQQYICYRAMDRKIGIIAFLGLEEVGERFFVPAVEVRSLSTVPVGPRLALELGKPDLLKDVMQRALLHLEHPDQIAH